MRKKKKKSGLPIITCALAMILLFIGCYSYINSTTKASAYEQHIKNLKIQSGLGENYLTEVEKEQLEKERAKEEAAKKKEEEKIAKEQEAKKKVEDLAKKQEEEKAKAKEELLKKQMEEEEAKKKKEDSEKAKEVLIDVKLVKQMPELKNGCEVTSLAMMLSHAGINIDKVALSRQVKKDTTEIKYNGNGTIATWGDPDVGFVGDITGITAGYSINPKPLLELVNKYVKGVNLTNLDYSYIEKALNENKPVLAWVTSDFTTPEVNKTWKSGDKTIKAYFNQHAVLLTGYDSEYIYYNDPLKDKPNQKVKKEVFKNIWKSTGQKAITYEK